MHEFLYPIERTALKDYGVGTNTPNIILGDISSWLNDATLPWNRTNYLNVVRMMNDSHIVEMLFFHFDGPDGKEMGTGGELNNCKIYLCKDRVDVSFTANNKHNHCALVFKYSTPWIETDHGILRVISKKLNEHISNIRREGHDRIGDDQTEIIVIKAIAAIADNTIIDRFEE